MKLSIKGDLQGEKKEEKKRIRQQITSFEVKPLGHAVIHFPSKSKYSDTHDVQVDSFYYFSKELFSLLLLFFQKKKNYQNHKSNNFANIDYNEMMSYLDNNHQGIQLNIVQNINTKHYCNSNNHWMTLLNILNNFDDILIYFN